MHLKHHLVSLCLLGATTTFCPASEHRTVITRIPPAYPELARRMGVYGTVVVHVLILPNGTVSETHIESGHRLLAPAAEQAVHQWRFATSPDPTDMDVEVIFSPPSHP